MRGLDLFPFSDLPIIYGIKTLMIISIAICFGIKLEQKKAREILITFGVSAGTTISLGLCGYTLASIFKKISGIGSVIGGIINASVGASINLTIGKLAVKYFAKIFGDKDVNTFLNSKACNKGIYFFNEF